MEVGDKITVDGVTGRIVALISEGKFSSDYPQEHWAYLKSGVLIVGEDESLVHFPEFDSTGTILEEHTSPDGKLRLIVICPTGDLTIGFDGYPWHTHGDILASLSETSATPAEATRTFIDNIISSKLIIAVSAVHGTVRDIWIAEDTRYDTKYFDEGESLTFRRWDGTTVEGVPCSA